jgi:hypothetical protein
LFHFYKNVVLAATSWSILLSSHLVSIYQHWWIMKGAKKI